MPHWLRWDSWLLGTSLSLCIFGFGTADMATAQTSSSASQETVRAQILTDREAIWRAWFSNDRSELSALLPDRVIAINFGEDEWQDRQTVIQSSESWVESGGGLVSLDFPRTEFQIFGDVAVLYSIFEIETVYAGERSTQRGRATEVFIKEDGRWKNAGWHLDSGQ